jgi:hypothetical protein
MHVLGTPSPFFSDRFGPSSKLSVRAGSRHPRLILFSRQRYAFPGRRSEQAISPREPDGKHRSLTGGAVGQDGAAVLLRDLRRHGQADALPL